MDNNVGAGIYEELEGYFTTVCKQLTKQVKVITKRHAKACREKIKRESPIDTTSAGEKVHGVYKNGWRVSTDEAIYGIDCTVHQYRRPSLTWILEHGHLNADGSRTKPQPHINKNAEEELKLWYEELEQLVSDENGISKW